MTEPTFSLRLDDRVVLVTGTAHGIGSAYATGLAEAGAKVVLVDIDPAGAEVAARINDGGGDALFLTADVSSESSVSEVAAAVQERHGVLDGLVNNAALDGAPTATPLLELDPDHYDRVLGVNVKGMWLVTRAVLPLLEKSEAAAVVNQGSIGSFLAPPQFIPYSTSKAAIINLTKVLAKELGPHGVRVNCLAPGSIATESVFRSIPEESLKEMIESQCIQRHQQPEDLLGPLLFLLSGASAFVTGQTLVADGGLIMIP